MMRFTKWPKKNEQKMFSGISSIPFWRRLSTLFNLYNLVFSSLFIFSAIFISYSNGRQIILQDTYNLLSSNNLNKSTHFRQWIRNNEESNQFLAARPLVREGVADLIACMDQGESCSLIENKLLNNHLHINKATDEDFVGFFIIRASDGMIITGTDSNMVGKFREQEDYFIEGLRAPYTEISTYHFSEGEAVMRTATPIYSPDGEVIAVLSAHLILEEMHEIIQQHTGFSDSVDSYMVNRFNYFLTEPLYGEDFALRKSVHTDGVKACLAENSGIAQYEDYRGTPVFGAYQWLPEFEICMISEMDETEAIAPVLTMRNQLFLIGFLLFIGALFAGFFIFRRITKPIGKLNKVAQKFIAGDLSERVNIKSQSEIGLFANTFNEMADNLQTERKKNTDLIAELKDFNSDLEARVAERTKNLKAAQLASLNIMQDLQKEAKNREQAQIALNKKARDLERSNKDLQQFAYVASHDLQEPLRMVASYLQLLEHRYNEKLDQDAREFIGYAVDGASRMKTLINDLLQFSRVGTRGKPFELTDLNSVLGRVHANLQFTINDANALISCDELPTVMADPSQMAQLFQNLVANAIKFHGEELPRVHIKAEESEKEWIISVTDNGIGIDPQYFDRIFIIFQRLHTRSEYEGTGIGLAVARRIVERHKGRIWVDSEPGKGTTFFIALPKVENNNQQDHK